MTRFLTILVTFLVGAVCGVYGGVTWVRSSHTPASCVDDRGMVAGQGIITITNPKQSLVRTVLEGMTTRTDKEPPHGVRVVVTVDERKKLWNPLSRECVFPLADFAMRVDAREERR